MVGSTFVALLILVCVLSATTLPANVRRRSVVRASAPRRSRREA